MNTHALKCVLIHPAPLQSLMFLPGDTNFENWNLTDAKPKLCHLVSPMSFRPLSHDTNLEN